MASFSNVTNTSATISTSFDYSDYARVIGGGTESLAYAMNTLAYENPVYQEMYGDDAWLEFSDGTGVYLGFSSVGTTSATVNELTVFTPYALGLAPAWLDAEGSGKIGLNADGEIASASSFTLKSVSLGAYSYAYDESADLTLDGSFKLYFETGAFSGKATSVTMKWLNDDVATDAIEWDYVTLKGSIGVGNGGLSFSSISGKITSIEWGTALDDFSDNLQFVASGSAGGLKLDVGSAMNALATDGFAGLSASMYSGNDTINGTAGNDFLDAFTGNDKVNGGEGADEIYGGAGNDQLTGGAGDDYIDGGAGNDKISDDSGNNTVVDESGNAQITLGAGSDSVFTGTGNDKITAGDGVNWVESGAGNDTITTGAGADVIYGGEGADKINGGAGSDVFVFDNLAVGGKDLINDFNATEDFFAFDTSVFTALAGGITDTNIVNGKAAVETVDYLIFDTQGGKLYYDADGSGAGAAVQIAVVKGSLTGLDTGNFIDEATLFA